MYDLGMRSFTSHKAASTGTGNGDAIRGLSESRIAVEVIVEAVGATPTMTWKLQGSNDGTNWHDVQLKGVDGATASTFTQTAVGAKWATPADPTYFFDYYRVVPTANTNVTFRSLIHQRALEVRGAARKIERVSAKKIRSLVLAAYPEHPDEQD